MLAFYVLSLAITILFLPRVSCSNKAQVSAVMVLLSLLVAYWQGAVQTIGLSFALLGGLLLMCSLLLSNDSLRRMSAVALVTFSLACALHLVPGYENELLYVDGLLSPEAVPYSLYANLDKALAGYLLATYVLVQLGRRTQQSGVKQSFSNAFIVVGVLPFALMGLAYALGLVTWHPKVPDIWLEFIFVNLFATCLAEEALFRGILQRLFIQVMPAKPWLGLIIVSTIFGCAHFSGGIEYVLVATLAGLGYGYIYFKTEKLSWAIVAHFSVNLLHFFAFTYPMLA